MISIGVLPAYYLFFYLLLTIIKSFMFNILNNITNWRFCFVFGADLANILPLFLQMYDAMVQLVA